MNISGTNLKDLAKRAGVTYSDAKRLIDQIADAVASGERVQVRHLGSFVLREENDSKSKPLVKFNVSKSLRDKAI